MTDAWALWLGGAIIAFMIGMQARLWLRARHAQGRPAPDTAHVDGAAHADRVRVYYFYAAHCGHCRNTTPLVDQLHITHRNLIKLDIADARELAQAFGIAATPAFAQVVDGTIQRVQLGGINAAQLQALLQTDSPDIVQGR